MEKIEIEIHEDVVSVIDRIKNLTGSEAELFFPEGSVIFDNGLNLRLIKKESEKLNKTVLFSTNDSEGRYLISLVEDSVSIVSGDSSSSDFVSHEVSLNEVVGEKQKNVVKTPFKINMALPKIPNLKAPKLAMPKLSMPKLNFKFGGVLLGIACAGLIFGFGYWYLWNIPKAEVNIVLKSEPLVKSVPVSVVSGGKNSASLRTLEGRNFASAVTETVTTSATGSMIVGESAEGKVKIINRTTLEKTFKKGEKLHYKDDDDLKFTLDDGVTVPGAQLQDPLVLDSPLIPGTAEVSVTATAYGKDYNLAKGKTLEFDKYSTTDYISEIVVATSGGSSEVVKVVTQADLDKLTTDIAAVFKEKGSTAIKSGVQQGWTLINGSESSTSVSKKYNKKVGDVSDEVELTETVNFQGLGYSISGLNSLLTDFLAEFLPTGYELSKKNQDIRAEILGNTDKTVLTSTKADLQVTVKGFRVAVLNEEDIKTKLLGISYRDAEKMLSEIKNVETYGVNLNPKIPILNQLPKNPANISLNVTLE